jgi:hypothetical protein
MLPSGACLAVCKGGSVTETGVDLRLEDVDPAVSRRLTFPFALTDVVPGMLTDADGRAYVLYAAG